MSATVPHRAQERPGLIDDAGKLRDLSAHCATIGWDELSPAGLKRLAAIDPQTLPRVRGKPRLGVPFTGISKFIGIGLNYRDHAIEAGMPIPSEPIVFMKATTCINGPDDPILLPPGSIKTDWEVELGIVIGREARPCQRGPGTRPRRRLLRDQRRLRARIPARARQPVGQGQGLRHLRPDRPLAGHRGTKCPIRRTSHLWLEVNGKRVQDGSTATMIFGCREIVSYLSRFMTLLPGDVIATGTPPGVGLGMKPPRFLGAGDTVRLGVEGLGEQRQTVRAA